VEEQVGDLVMDTDLREHLLFKSIDLYPVFTNDLGKG
jgi:hypothetical protein